MHGNEPHVPLGNGIFGKPGDFPEDGDTGVCFDALPDEGGVPRGSHAVENNAREIDGFEVGHPAMTAAAVRVILVTVRVSRTGAPRARASVAVEQLPCTSRPSYRPRLPSIMARSALPNEVQKSARNRASVKKKGSRLVGVRPEARPSHAASM